MRIIKDNTSREYVDQDLFDHIKNIWITYNDVIPNDSKVFFAKNTTINRLITDYCDKNIKRVIKKEKATVLVLNLFNIKNFPQYWDGQYICNDDTKEVCYGIYNLSSEDRDTIKLILEFINTKQQVKYINQDRFNDSINNGFVIDNDNYTTIKELASSNFIENQELAVNMLLSSDLSKNWEWILYLYYH